MSYTVPHAPAATFASLQTQSIANAANAQAITYDTTIAADGISLASSSRIVFSRPGDYAVSFSAIGHDSGSSSPKWINIWLRKDGSDLANTSTYVATTQNAPLTIVATFVVTVTAANQYVELYMAGETTGSQILYTPASAGGGGIPAFPASPSIVVAVWQTSN